MELIKEKITELAKRKEENLTSYYSEPENIQDVLAAQNFEISMTIRFLEKVDAEIEQEQKNRFKKIVKRCLAGWFLTGGIVGSVITALIYTLIS